MTTLTRADWEQRAKDLKIEGRAYINGEYTAAASGDTFECISPVDGRLLATVASCDVADAQRAVENARVERGRLILGAVVLGDDACVSSYAVLEGNVVVGDHGHVEGQCALGDGTRAKRPSRR